MKEPLKVIRFPVLECATQKNITGACFLYLHTDYAERFINIKCDLAETDEDETILSWQEGKIMYEKSSFSRAKISSIQITRHKNKIGDPIFYRLYIDVDGVAEPYVFKMEDKREALEMYEYLLEWWQAGKII